MKKVMFYLMIVFCIISVLLTCEDTKDKEDNTLVLDNLELETTEVETAEVETSNKDTNIDLETIPELYVEDIDMEHYKELGLPIVMHFGADWCQPCKEMRPYIEDLYTEYRGKITLVYVNVDDVNIDGYPIRVVPTQFFFNSDGTPFTPSEDIIGDEIYSWLPHISKETGRVEFITHQGTLTKQTLIDIFEEMGLK